LFSTTSSIPADIASLTVVMQYSKNVLRRFYYDYYFHRQENLWRQNALKTLPALLNSSDMLACGEDLGLIPACVHPVCLFNPSQLPTLTARISTLFSYFIISNLHSVKIKA
jgi:hypothetical protein